MVTCTHSNGHSHVRVTSYANGIYNTHWWYICFIYSWVCNTTALEKQMSTPHAQERLETIFEEVKAAFPYYDEDKQAEIAMKRFDEELV